MNLSKTIIVIILYALPIYAGKYDNENSLTSAMHELAGERFNHDQSYSNIVLLATHDYKTSPKVHRIKTELCIVISLPIYESNQFGLCSFVSHYNSRNIEIIDDLLCAGEYNRAETLYNALSKIDACGHTSVAVSRRLDQLDKLRQGILSTKAFRNEFQQACKAWPSWWSSSGEITVIETNLQCYIQSLSGTTIE